MTPDRTTRELLEQLQPQHEPAAVADGPDDWMLGELCDSWRAAEAEAEAAYQAWKHTPGPDAYVIYRAAEDRAHAAQEALRSWTHTRRTWLHATASASA